jgi:hypothetical protein
MVRAMRSQLLLTPVVAAACVLPGARSAQEPANAPTISTNRPSFSDAASLVPAGHLQVETGHTFTKRNREGVATERHAAPEVLARFRVLDRLEAQLLWGGYAWQDAASGGATTADDGAVDFGVGVRVPIAEQDGWLPQLALGGIATLGTGRGAFGTNQHTVPTGKVLWAYTLDGGYGLGGNLIASYPYDGQQRFDQVGASVYGTKALDDRTTVFGEYYVVSPYANGTGPAHTVDGGVLFLVSGTVQLDARVGFGLNDEADDVLAGAGISFLF